ncbi:MAG TPA: alpha-glucuronidase family glycosyl hydrolase [Planctomycetaceae bacterium]
MELVIKSGRFVAMSALLLYMAGDVIAGPQVDVVVGSKSPELDRFAAAELASQFKQLFDADVRITDKVPAQSTHLILIGNSDTNPAIAGLGVQLPKLSEQGHMLRFAATGKQQALIVRGGSPVATLWAVYELGQRLGIRYMLFGDLYPIDKPDLNFENVDVVLEPKLRLRTWRTINDFPIGPESWGLAEQERVLKQLAKLKYNRVMLAVYPWQPFVDFEFNGIKKQTGVLWYGYRYPVDGDTAGRAAFRGAKLFENPDFAGKNSYAERVAAGTKLARGIIAAAGKLGMSTALAFSPLEFPKEFAPALPGATTLTGLESLTIGPGATQRTDDSTLMALVKAQIRAYLTTYPDVDTVYLSLPEFPEWGEHAEEAWEKLAARSGIGSTTSLEKLTAVARDRKLISSGERGVQALRGNVTALEFFNRLLADRELWRLPGGRAAKVVITDIDSALFPLLDKVLPPGTATLNFVDYTARRVAQHRDLLKQVPTRAVPSSLILTLADDNVGVLPQMTYTSLATLVDELRSDGWEGFSTRYWVVGDLDLSVYFLSRASFISEITPRQAIDELLTPVLGEGTAERTFKAFDLVEQATNLIDEHDMGFSFPILNVVMKHYASAEPVPEWWGQVKERYLQAMEEMYRVNTRARDGGRPFSLYFARRFEFAAEYMSCIEAVRKAGIAKAKGDRETQTAELEKAVESLHTSLNALSAVARSNSDRGIIAVLNEYGYRPLKRELEGE